MFIFIVYIISGMYKCIGCGEILVGRQRKYCSRLCKNSYNNQSYQSYQAQQLRGRSRKIELIRLKGSKCETCGYKQNFAALEFHHANPKKNYSSLT